MNTKCKVNYIDISVSLSEELPVWPGGYGFHKHPVQTIGTGSEANVTRLDFDVHSGTHIDGPLHFIKDGKPTSAIALEKLLGDAIVLLFENLEVITDADFKSKQIPRHCKKVLLKTDNSKNQWHRQAFDTNFVAINNEAAKYLVEKGIELVGIDGPSIQKFYDPIDTHVTLLQNEVVILEGLNLQEAEERVYELICLPIKASGCEGISARAILKNHE